MPIQIVIWDKQNDVAVNSEGELFVGTDGLVYEVRACHSYHDTWLDWIDVSGRYEVRLRE